MLTKTQGRAFYMLASGVCLVIACSSDGHATPVGTNGTPPGPGETILETGDGSVTVASDRTCKTAVNASFCDDFDDVARSERLWAPNSDASPLRAPAQDPPSTPNSMRFTAAAGQFGPNNYSAGTLFTTITPNFDTELQIGFWIRVLDQDDTFFGYDVLTVRLQGIERWDYTVDLRAAGNGTTVKDSFADLRDASSTHNVGSGEPLVPAFTKGKWQRVELFVVRSPSRVLMTIDGALVIDRSAADIPLTVKSASMTFGFGSLTTNVPPHFAFEIDDVRVAAR